MTTKKLSFLLVIVFVFVFGKTPAQINLTQGLLLYLPFTGNANDASGNTNVAVVNGPVLTADRFGAPNSAYYFDGVDDFIALTGGSGMKPSFPMSFSAWINITSNINGVNNFFNNDYLDNSFYGVWGNFSGSAGYYFAGNVGDGGAPGPTNRKSKISNVAINLGTWYHVAAVIYSETNMRLFINCEEVSAYYDGTGGPLVYSTTGIAVVGKGDGGGANIPPTFINANIDELRFYNRALNDTEIVALYDFPVYPPALLYTLPTNNLTLQCGSTVNIDGTFTGIISYDWADGPTGPTRTFTTPGTYIMEAFDGCLTGYDTVVVTSSQAPTTVTVTTPPAACVGEPVTITAIGAQNYTWTPATGLNTTTGPTVTATLNDTTTYTVIGTGACGTDTAIVTLNTITAAPAGFTFTVNECTGAVQATNTAIGATSYLWKWDYTQSTLANPVIQFMNVGDHDVVLITNPGTSCADTAVANVTTFPSGEETVYIPNAFTPNGDGRNDVFIPFRDKDCLDGELFIFNRWGEEIFHTKKPFIDFWDGKYKDYQVPVGIYTYRLALAGGKDVMGMIAVIK